MTSREIKQLMINKIDVNLLFDHTSRITPQGENMTDYLHKTLWMHVPQWLLDVVENQKDKLPKLVKIVDDLTDYYATLYEIRELDFNDNFYDDL